MFLPLIDTKQVYVHSFVCYQTCEHTILIQNIDRESAFVSGGMDCNTAQKNRKLFVTNDVRIFQ